MLTFYELITYAPFMIWGSVIILLLGILLLVVCMWQKSFRRSDIAFLLLAAGFLVFTVLMVNSTEIIYTEITPCSISENYVADITENMYYADDKDILKLHINQTREVVFIKYPLTSTRIAGVPGKIYPSGIPANCQR